MRIAVLPVGYYEGYDRRLSNIGHALINGVRAPVRGRICMNMAMVDISHIPHVERGDSRYAIGPRWERRGLCVPVGRVDGVYPIMKH